MKNFKCILLAQLFTVSALLFAGCGVGQQPPMGPMGMSTPPNGEMGFGGTDDASYTALNVDKDKLYSQKDLEMDPDLSEATTINANDDSSYVIDSAGVYILTGEAHNFTVQVETDKKDKVLLVLDDVTVSNDNFPVIYVKSADKCFVNLSGNNTLSVTGDFISDGDTNTDAVIFTKDDMTINGTGALIIESGQGNGIASKDDLTITGGKFSITCKNDAIEANEAVLIRDGEFIINAESDGIQSDTYIIVDGGTFDINSKEGIEATFIQINGGTIDIYASDDGINATKRSDDLDVVIEVNGGEIIVEAGPGDTDGFDANGVIAINGGTVNVKGQSAFDYDRGAAHNGGTIIINGEEVDEIPEPMMGAPGFTGDKGPEMHGDKNPGRK